MAIYAGIGKNSHEIQLDTREVKLWDVTVNSKRQVYRGTEQDVTEFIWNKFYYEDWHIAPRKFLALASQIIDVRE